MTIRRPILLESDDRIPAAAVCLKRYYGDPFLSAGAYSGAWFDEWDSTHTRMSDADRFTADDLIAIEFLSVQAGPSATRALLHDVADRFNALLAEIGEDRDLADVSEPINKDWPAWRLETALCSLPGIGLTKATKLIARKRPRLYPI